LWIKSPVPNAQAIMSKGSYLWLQHYLNPHPPADTALQTPTAPPVVERSDPISQPGVGQPRKTPRAVSTALFFIFFLWLKR